MLRILQQLLHPTRKEGGAKITTAVAVPGMLRLGVGVGVRGVRQSLT